MSRPYFRTVFLASILLISAASTASAQWGAASRTEPGFEQGFQRGQRAGTDDLRRGERFNFSDEAEYRRGDTGYRPQYGDRNWYRDSFRRGFESGYRTAYNYGNTGRGGPSGPWAGNGRQGRFDVAVQQGYSDGYEAGLDAARDRDRFDPIREGRYRSGDRGYNRSYGSRDVYKANYRSGFRNGYEAGYQDGGRYNRW